MLPRRIFGGSAPARRWFACANFSCASKPAVDVSRVQELRYRRTDRIEAGFLGKGLGTLWVRFRKFRQLPESFLRIATVHGRYRLSKQIVNPNRNLWR